MSRRATLGLAAALSVFAFAAPSRAAGPVGQLYVPATACRVLDTRLPAAPLGGPALSSGEARTLPVAGTCGVPSSALSLAVNLTVVNPSATGFAVLYAGDAAFPPTSNLAFSAHKTRAGFSIVSLASDGSGTVVLANGSPGNADFVLDVEGWFVRACTSTITVTNPGVTTGTVNTAFSQTFTGSGGVGSLTFSTASPLPAGLTLSSGGVLSGTPTQPGSFDVFVTATDANGCTGTGARYTLVISCQTIAVSNPGVTTGTANAPFSQQFTQTGGSGTTTFSTTDPLPIGLTLAANGLLSGTPTQAGVFNVKVKATDANGCTGTGATYPLVINCQTITVTNPATNTGTAGAAFSQTFTQSGAIGATTFSLASGTLPTGLALAANGVLSGTPTQVGSFPITVKVTDGNLCSGTGGTYTLTIGCQTIAVGNPAVTTATAGTAFSQPFTQSGAIGGATFTTASTLPAGLTLAANGVLAGTPTQTGSFPIVVTVTDANGCTGAGATYTLVVNCQTFSVEPAALPPATSGVAYPGVTFTAPGGIGSVTVSFTGTLPTGMSLTGGVLSGTPTQTGSFPITVKATDANGCTAQRDYILVVACPGTPITLSPGTLPTVPANSAFPTTQFTASGGTGPYTFQQVGALPAGMQFLTDTLSGTPTQIGTFPITVVATDTVGACVGSQDYVVTVSCVGTSISALPGTVPGGTAGTPYAPVTFSGTGGTAPYVLAEAGVLPAGMTFSGGVLSGTPTGAGTFPFTVTATDSNGCSGQTNYSLVVACQPISVTNPATTSAIEGNSFDVTFTATGLLGTATWSTASTLPTGLSLNASTGHLSGTPTQTGSFDIVVKATDTNGCFGTGATYTLTITCPTITVSGSIPGQNYNFAMAPTTFTQTGTSSTVTWSASGLPAGLTINSSTGQVSGTPTATGTFTATITATDAGGCTGSKSVTFPVSPTIQIQSYTGVGNTQLYVSGLSSPPSTPAVVVAPTLLTGAQPAGGVTVTAASCLLGGTLTTFDASGRFLFTPDVSATSASCSYTVSSNTGGTPTPTSVTASLNFTLNNRVWWVDNASIGTHDGRSNTPFTTMTAVGSAATSNGDFVYVFKGSGATTGAYAMKPSQSLIGAGATLNVPIVSPILTVAGAGANTPTLSGTVTLANSVVVNGIDMSTGASRAITNFNGASYTTVTGVSVTARTVTTTTGTAIDLRGSSNTGTMSFTTVNANGGLNGIVVSNFTGGSFTITGAGGNCSPADATCTGGTIQSMTGGDDSSSTPVGTGVVFNNVSNVSLTRMRIRSNSNYDVRGTSVAGFVLDNSLLDGTTGTNGATPFNEGAVSFDNLTGSATVSNSNIQGGLYNNFRVVNTLGTLNRLTFTNVTFDVGANTTFPTNDALTIESQNAAVVNVTVQNSVFKSAAGDLFQLNNIGTGADDLVFTGNTLTNANSAIATGGGGITIGSAGTGDITYNLDTNTFRNAVGTAVVIVKSAGAASVTGTFNNNAIGVSGVANSGSAEGDGLKVQNAGLGTVKATITNNQIRQYNNFGIDLIAGGGAVAASGALNVVITGNTIAEPGTTAGTIGIPKNGIQVNAGTVPGDTYQVCVQIGGAGALANALTGSGAESSPPSGLGAIDFRLRQRQSTTVKLPGYGGANNDNAAVVTFVQNNNGTTPTGLASNTVPTGGGFTGGTPCP